MRSSSSFLTQEKEFKPEKSLSKSTIQWNHDINSSMELFFKINPKNDDRELLDESRSKLLFAKAKNQSIELQARLNGLLVDSEKLHTQLDEDRTETFCIAEGLGMFLKVELKNKSPPLILSFGYENPKDNKLVKAYYSTDF